MGTYDVAANLQQNHASFKTLPPRVPFFSVVAEVSIAISAQTHRTIRTEFDKTEPAYYSGTMTTPRNHTTRGQTHARNMQTADRVTPRPQSSPVILPPNRRTRQETMPNSRSGGFDTIQQNPTECGENSCARTRARQQRSLPSSRHGLRPGRNAFLESQSPNRHANRSNETDRTASSYGHHVNMIRPNHQTRRRSVTSLNACDIIVPYRSPIE